MAVAVLEPGQFPPVSGGHGQFSPPGEDSADAEDEEEGEEGEGGGEGDDVWREDPARVLAVQTDGAPGAAWEAASEGPGLTGLALQQCESPGQQRVVHQLQAGAGEEGRGGTGQGLAPGLLSSLSPLPLSTLAALTLRVPPENVARAALISRHGPGPVDPVVVGEDCEAVQGRHRVGTLYRLQSGQDRLGVGPHLHLAQHQVLVVRPLVPDVDKVPVVTLPFVTLKLHPGLSEGAGPLRARFIERIAALQQLDDEDGEVLEPAGLDGHGDGLHHLRAEEPDLPPPRVRGPGGEAAGLAVPVNCQLWEINIKPGST